MASKKRVLKVKRKKKVWFKVLSPEVYGKREIGEITAFEAKNLIGRVIKLSARDLTTSRDQNQKISLRVTEVKGDTAETEVIKSNIVDSVVQKKSRKIKQCKNINNKNISKIIQQYFVKLFEVSF